MNKRRKRRQNTEMSMAMMKRHTDDNEYRWRWRGLPKMMMKRKWKGENLSGMNGERSELMRKKRMNRCQCKIDEVMSVYLRLSVFIVTCVRRVAIMKEMQPPLWVCELKIWSHLSCSVVTFLVSWVIDQVASWVMMTARLFNMIAHNKRLSYIHILFVDISKCRSMPSCVFIKIKAYLILINSTWC